ncbi:MAG: hypothetical protein HYU63_02140, partial [Armatimonadetes bacterium]|nr:hypothetical protein [Armatimonadota bacterium]
RQVLFVTSDGLSAAPDRYDWFLSFPPYLEAVLLGLTSYEMRFGNGLDYAAMQAWISNIDWSDREVVGSHAEKYGWRTDRAGVFNGSLYFVQTRWGKKRYGVIRFLTPS